MFAREIEAAVLSLNDPAAWKQMQGRNKMPVGHCHLFHNQIQLVTSYLVARSVLVAGTFSEPSSPNEVRASNMTSDNP